MGFYLKAKHGLNKTWDKSKNLVSFLEDRTVERERGEERRKQEEEEEEEGEGEEAQSQGMYSS